MNFVYETRFERVGETERHYKSYRLGSSQKAIEFGNEVLRDYFSDKLNQEEFLIVTLNTQLCPIRIVRITRGTLDASLVHPREVFRPAIADCAFAILLVHNHPSGDPTPSPQDRAVTDRLTEVGKIVGITVLDHIIIGDTVVSLAESR